ncbi:hypothetical protein B484DRAFT_446661 [Ochromonadaceae sp. CCMP2298]|nr:hypothetical protein B484DRAFT_446661 [Ochromonadaceae sp. CCMP2298]
MMQLKLAATRGVWLLLLVCVWLSARPVGAEGTDYIVPLDSCADADLNEVDRAKISFSVPASSQAYDLYATNALCYRCSMTLVGEGAVGTASCASLYTPHEWRLYLVDPTDPGVVVAQTSYTFGDQGEYAVSVVGASMGELQLHVAETESPVDPYVPLYWLTGILLCLVAASYAGPALVARLKDRGGGNGEGGWSKSKFSTGSGSLQEGMHYSAVPLIDQGAGDERDEREEREEGRAFSRESQYSLQEVDLSPPTFSPALSPLRKQALTPQAHMSPHSNHSPQSTHSPHSPLGPHGLQHTSPKTPPSAPASAPAPAPTSGKPERLHSLDTFRGISLCCMIFVNYGGGGYWFFDHAAWNGLTVADLLFPWFMWMMGVSMALSFSSTLRGQPRVAPTTTTAAGTTAGTSAGIGFAGSVSAGGAGGVVRRAGGGVGGGVGVGSADARGICTERPFQNLGINQGMGMGCEEGQEEGPRSSSASSYHTALSGQPAGTWGAWLLSLQSSTLCGIDWVIWYRVLRRTLILFGLGMFLANGYDLSTWRVPGVLQYFAVSYAVTAATVLVAWTRTKKQLHRLQADCDAVLAQTGGMGGMGMGGMGGWLAAGGDGTSWLKWGGPLGRLARYFTLTAQARVLTAYCYEWGIQGLLLATYLAITLGAKAPGCPRGYMGPGGISDEGRYEGCTGGVHRYIDMQVLGDKLIYHHPTCVGIYQCQAYDPEGILGAMGACTLTYLGLMAGRVVLHYKDHFQRLAAWTSGGFSLLLLAGILCGFSREQGIIPISKNLWSVSFCLVTAGGGMMMLALCYSLVDLHKIWTGAPFRYLGMNSIVVYCGHSLLGEYMPFSYKLGDVTHQTMLQTNVLGTTCWVLIAAYFYHIKFFVKI